MDEKKVRVRIAPSPTGFAHVGSAYTALFNYAFAKKNNGEFIVRFEDSDVKRNLEGSEQAILDGLKWVGLSWDEGTDIGGPYAPYRLSDRMDLYKSKIDELLEKGLAYEDDGAVRFKNTREDISWNDLVRGEVKFPGDQITDFVIRKSDGYPTYNLAVVVDDIAMKMTHIIRGDEHISNTPRQIALYKAFGAEIPEFAHHPTLRNKQHKKLSKRHDPVDLKMYKEEGYLPQAILNFLCLMGWSHPEEKEIFGLDEFVELFSLDRVLTSGPVFDTDKLDWINGEYIRKMSIDEFVNKLSSVNDKFGKWGDDNKKSVAELIQTRINKLSDAESLISFFFEKPEVEMDRFDEDYKEHLATALECIENVEKWNLETLNDSLMKNIQDKGYKVGKFFMNLRIAITGKKISPPINESIIVLGKQETVLRLKNVLT